MADDRLDGRLCYLKLKTTFFTNRSSWAVEILTGTNREFTSSTCRWMEPIVPYGSLNRFSQWYSHKNNAAALSYEVAVSVPNGDIVWVAVPYHAGRYPDLRIYLDGIKD